MRLRGRSGGYGWSGRSCQKQRPGSLGDRFDRVRAFEFVRATRPGIRSRGCAACWASPPAATTRGGGAAAVQRRFEAAKPNQVWVADITYVPTQEGFLYLATVLDVFSRKVVGWAMSARQTVELVQSGAGDGARDAAARGVGVPFRPRLPVHDAGVQPALRRGRHQRSMGRVGSCFDNAMAESLFATVECELLQRTPFESREQAPGEIFKFLEAFTTGAGAIRR